MMPRPPEVQPHKWYLVEGSRLISVRLRIEAIMVHVASDDPAFSKDILIQRLQDVIAALPKNPAEAF